MDGSSPDTGDRGRLPVHADGGCEQVDRLLDALGTYRRRCVLYHLAETNPAELDEVARAVAAMENDQPSDSVPAEVRDTVKRDLYHNTLPKLAELNVIEYDPRSETVCYQYPPPHIDKLLELTRTLDPVSEGDVQRSK